MQEINNQNNDQPMYQGHADETTPIVYADDTEKIIM